MIREMSRVSLVEAELFKTLDWFRAPRFPYLNDEHFLRLRIHHARLAKLKQFIDEQNKRIEGNG